MHKDIEVMKDVEKPQSSQVTVVYFSSISNNTHRFIQKLNFKNYRIPYELSEKISVDEDYVLIIPTYSGGGGDTKGAVPKQVKQFLNDEKNRSHCKGVIASGNTNFGDTFCLAGIYISKKLNVPLLYQFELLGTKEDIDKVSQILNNFWGFN